MAERESDPFENGQSLLWETELKSGQSDFWAQVDRNLSAVDIEILSFFLLRVRVKYIRFLCVCGQPYF